MIQKMNKYSFLIFHREYEDFLSYIQDLGVVHVAERNDPREAEALRALQEQRTHALGLSRQLQPYLPADAPDVLEGPSDMEVVSSVEQSLAEIEATTAHIASLRQTIGEQRVWGDYDLSTVARLTQAGYRLALYTTSSSVYTPDYQTEYETIAIDRVGATQYFARIEGPGAVPCPDAEAQPLPKQSLAELEAQLASATQTLEAQRLALTELAPAYIVGLQAWDRELAGQYAFGAARLQAAPQAEDTLMLLEGWVPAARAQHMEAELSSTGYYYRQSEIEDEDKIPVLLRNNFFSRLFEPITQMFSLPNYSEIDQTALFAPFFLLFFGLCFGDGGYGLLLMAIATIVKLRRRGQDNTLLSLLQWLGGGAFVVGMLMGSFFGVTLGYAKAEDYFLNQDALMKLSIVLGLIQILFAKGVAAYKTKVQRGWRHALAPTAWVFVLIFGGLLIALPRLEFAIPIAVEYVVYAIVGISVAIVLLYNTPGKNPLVNIGSALWTTYNVASGLLGDTLSYIRLFAIGLTGGILGGVFNQLAIEQTAGLSPVLQYPLMLFILLVGHTLNMGLAMISSFVHPLRLTFVEYYKNSEFEGGGKPYNPLSKS